MATIIRDVLDAILVEAREAKDEQVAGKNVVEILERSGPVLNIPARHCMIERGKVSIEFKDNWIRRKRGFDVAPGRMVEAIASAIGDHGQLSYELLAGKQLVETLLDNIIDCRGQHEWKITLLQQERQDLVSPRERQFAQQLSEGTIAQCLRRAAPGAVELFRALFVG